MAQDYEPYCGLLGQKDGCEYCYYALDAGLRAGDDAREYAHDYQPLYDRIQAQVLDHYGADAKAAEGTETARRYALETASKTRAVPPPDPFSLQQRFEEECPAWRTTIDALIASTGVPNVPTAPLTSPAPQAPQAPPAHGLSPRPPPPPPPPPPKTTTTTTTTTKPQPLPPPPTTSNWNERFQTALELPTSTPGLETERAQSIGRVCRQFKDQATEIAEIIISEVHVKDPRAKRIPPAQGMGGQAGGEKFVHNGILYKFARDWRGIYAGQDGAMKAAGCELRGLHAIAGAGIQKLSVPLCCVVDYLGWRLVAVALLPIDAQTLVYGSDNCGATIARSDDEVVDLMRQLGISLNIAEHSVRCRNPPHEVCRLYGPADLEVHRGHDGRIYCLDAARIMPPQNPFAVAHSDRNVQRPKGFLYDLFRVEFVTRFAETALSSDAFSGFGRAGHPIQEDKIAIADTVLRTVVIPAAARELAQRYNGLEVDLDLRGFLHRHGINMRFLGLVRKEIKKIRLSESVKPEDVCSDALVMTLAGEMVARSAKHVLRARLRDCRTLEDCRLIVVPFFNELTMPTFTSSAVTSSLHSSSTGTRRLRSGEGDALWNSILDDTERRFECALEGDTNKSRRSLVDVTWVRARLSEAVGLRWKTNALDSAIRSLRERDFLALRPLTKELSLVSGNFGKAKLRQAVALLKCARLPGSPDARDSLLQPAPTDVLITSLAHRETHSLAAFEMLSEAVHHFSLSLEARPSDVSMLLGRAIALSYQALTTAFRGHSKDTLFDEARVGFDAAARLAHTFYKRSRNQEDHARWVSIRLSAGTFYAREAVCRVQNDPKLAWMSALPEKKAEVADEEGSNLSSPHTTKETPSLPVAYRLDVSSNGIQKGKQLVSVKGLRGNISINPNLKNTWFPSAGTLHEKGRACLAARRSLDVFDDFVGKGDKGIVGHLESTILLWRASAFHVLVLHRGRSDKQKNRKFFEVMTEELENTLHCAYASAMRSFENEERDIIPSLANAATAAVQLGWFLLTAHRRDELKVLLPPLPLSPLLRCRRALNCAGRTLGQLHNAAIKAWGSDSASKSLEPPPFYFAAALASRVEHGLAELKLRTLDGRAEAISSLERAVRLVRFSECTYIDHLAVASLPTPSLVDAHQGPCARLLLVRGNKNKASGRADVASAPPMFARLSDALLRDSIRPPVKTVTLYYGNSVQRRSKEGAAWSMFVATNAREIDNKGATQSGNLVAALISMVGDSQIAYGAKHEAPSQTQKTGSRFDYYRKKHPLIDYVEYELHPTFPRPRRRKEYPPFSLHGGSWGIFQVSVTVGFRPPFSHVQVPLEFILSHDDGGVCHSIDVQLIPWGDVGRAHRGVTEGENQLRPNQAALMEELKLMASPGEKDVKKYDARGRASPRSQTKSRSQRKFTILSRKIKDKLVSAKNFTRDTESSRAKASPRGGLTQPRVDIVAHGPRMVKAKAKAKKRATSQTRMKIRTTR